ncbi:transcriptional regulator family: Fungal Specific TF [Penicillium roqueforti]|nr:transcriptional regulator family: Fungal Specific TF [Penicillium roqueforti]KAI3133190.1 transcriptional regulator family: Fungal Specific TF [Penicillium roqueforti]KAI3272663.1 transcriptional regulator family: Fungal Specific TF [Penicillium roqueforti]KAI3295987.1 transcriptional regulator family: Fungal Specific TF [Penicillium roqueforti]KAI3297530.1 transcriptional regulator family: Fungal Specific TF [Penicillium roqueforti]
MDIANREAEGLKQRRTRVACRRCNSKKIKCNSQEEVPCKGCVSTNTDCVPIESQRGRYIRKGPRARNARKSHVSQNDKEIPPIARSSTSPTSGVDNLAESEIPLPPEDRTTSSFQRTLDASDQDSDCRFYLHIADQGVSSTPQPISSQKGTLFLGESFSLTYVVHDVLAPLLSTECAPNYRRRLHFPVDEGFDPSMRGQQNMVEAQTKLLHSRDLWFHPDQRALEQLLAIYFKWFHPAFPILEKSTFLQKYNGNQLSLLLLNGVLMIAVTVCDEADLALLGLQDRYKARQLFYKQARALYETDSDPDKINNVVASFLISFWWGGPNDQKDSWHWLGIAISSAQNLGMHRSTAKSHMSSHRVRIWRRIWWCLRIRDVLVSSSIGRPQHFSVYDCDVEMLSSHDLEGEFQNETEIHYVCQMARLSTIFGNIISSRYAAVKPDHPSQMKIQLEKELDEFRSQMPTILRYTGIDAEGKICLWSAMLLMAYNFGVILLCRPPHSNGLDMSQSWGNPFKASSAANEVTRVIEDILSLSMGRVCQIHTIPALFNSLAIHVFTICTSRAIGRELAENRARTCMLGLTSLQESWPVSGWILRLFVYIMERLKSTSKSPTIPGSRPGLLDTGPNLGPGSHGTDTPAANTPRQYIDQGNINNAYLSGMAEELNFTGNELVHFQTIFTVGNVVALLPFMYLFPRVPMHWLVPTLDLMWGIFTLLQYRATSYAEIMAYRFLVSVFEASYFPGVHFVLGSWYKSNEIGRRGGAFYVGLTLGYLTASLLQGATLEYLDGVNGLPGWRWLFIINAIMTLPMALVGYFIYPGTVDKPNRLVISEHDLEIARRRLQRQGTQVKSASFSWALGKKLFLSKRFWLVLMWDGFFFNSSANTASFLLWLKSLHRYSSEEMNQLNSISPALGIFFILFVNISTDLWLDRTWAITLASSFNFTGLVILAIWNVPEGAKWFAYSVQYSSVAVSSVLYGWMNVLYRDNLEERAIVLVLATAISTMWTCWIPLFTYPTVEGPRFSKGYPFSAVMAACLVAMTFVMRYTYGPNGEKNIPYANDENVSEDESTGTIAISATEGAKKGQVSVVGTSL